MPEPRKGAAAAATDCRVIIFGGLALDEEAQPKTLGDLYILEATDATSFASVKLEPAAGGCWPAPRCAA
jgi:hypothetical protein